MMRKTFFFVKITFAAIFFQSRTALHEKSSLLLPRKFVEVRGLEPLAFSLRTKTIELEPDSASEKTRSARQCTTVHSKPQIKRSGVSLRVCYSYYPDFNFEIKK